MNNITDQFYSFPAPAKLNLFLHIIGQRSDGYHQLQTIFQFLDHCDTIDIKVTEGLNIELLTPIEGVLNEDNLIVRAAQLLQNYIIENKIINVSPNDQQQKLGAQIKITKILPMGGGLGGGSSNAATILLGSDGTAIPNPCPARQADVQSRQPRAPAGSATQPGGACRRS